MSKLLLSHRNVRKRHAAPAHLIDSNWQPIGLVVRRLMKRHSLPLPTAIVTAETFGLLGADR